MAYIRTSAQVQTAWLALYTVVANIKALDIIQQQDSTYANKYSEDLSLLTYAMYIHEEVEPYLDEITLNELLDNIASYNYYL